MGNLVALTAIVRALGERGFSVATQKLVCRLADGPVVDLVRGQEPRLVMTHGDGTRARVHFQRSFGRTGSPLASLSFDQRPDLVVETRHPDGSFGLLVLDPKYKLQQGSQSLRPKKQDIDKMHAYRDAIVHGTRRVVRHAAILYPGPAMQFGEAVSALPADPLLRGGLEEAVSELVGALLVP